jgi:site-specific recombinase XerD
LTFSRLRYGPAMTPDYAPSLLRSFERHLRAENRSDNTVESYLESIRQAEAFLAGRGRTLLDARRADLEAFLGDLLQRRAPATAATRYKVLRILYAWLEEEADPNPATAPDARSQVRALVARERASGPTVTAAEVMAVTGRSRRRAYELLRDARTEGEGTP